MSAERFEFAGHDGAPLAARLDRPVGAPRAAALFAHCFTCGKDIAAARRVAQGLAARGVAVLRFDFTGLGHSGGEFANTSFTTNVEDLTLAAAALAERVAPPQLLVGHSLGGAAVLAARAHIPSVRAVATIGAPADAEHVLKHLGGSLARIREEGAAEVEIGGRPVRVGRDFVEAAQGARLGEAVASLRAALLILHAPRDAVVGVDEASALFRAAKHPKSFVSLDDADHLLSRPEDAAYAADVIAAWAGRYLDPAEPPRDSPPEGVTRVREADPGGFLQQVSTGGHALLADEPASVGGTGRGPSPYQLLAAALGACTTMTLRMYARRKGLKLTGVAVDVSHGKSHAEDCEGCGDGDGGGAGGGRIDVFTREIALEGALSEAERARLLEIADRCPVHRTLERGARVETRER
ncbi:bifunctional alpha/beta hydrolase/OsmC family protein [Rubrimonas cliftonensis]|uniref:Putative redox protein n=1 Tax=Rubrimonas cliftonensis TaxID=89524 RepID=A0A1H4AFR8_9RHOB|nr:bifunctional alpha/beta hydrolase/OsmC family protein [Rubrimonas cliftonensis]SEA34364.1 putative redox protein [Rubrimonas cliftonensis]